MRKVVLTATIGGAMAFAAASTVHAQSADAPASMAVMPANGFFAGVGVNGNLVSPSSQSMYSQGISRVYTAGTLVANGAAGGPTNPNAPMTSSISPSAQLGYFQKFSDSPWMWGAKFNYNYINATSTANFVLVPQIGSFRSATTGVVTPFTGNVVIQSYQVTVNHQLGFVPFVGYSFDRSYIYGGIGPSLTQVDAKLNNTVGFASIGGVSNSITGTPTSYSSSQWLIGATFAVGATYFLTPSWFLDLGYAFTLTDFFNNTYSSPFTNTSSGSTTVGVLSGSYTGGVITHAITVSINRRF
jgi:opacity protein-like surface antigen